jgi:hypothetical protein
VAGFSKENCCFRKGSLTLQINSFWEFLLKREKKARPQNSRPRAGAKSG